MRLGNLFAIFRRRPENRNVFEFWDGQRLRRVDPMLVFRCLQGHPTFDADTHPGLVDAGDEEATQITIGAVRDAFGVTAFDGKSGLTEAESLELLATFWDWCGDLKKKTRVPPTSQPPTEPQSWVPSTPAPGSDSGSASIASSTVEAGP